MTVDQMYRCVLLDKNASKMLNFGGNQTDKASVNYLNKAGKKS